MCRICINIYINTDISSVFKRDPLRCMSEFVFEFSRITEKKRKRRNYEEILKSQALEIVFLCKAQKRDS